MASIQHYIDIGKKMTIAELFQRIEKLDGYDANVSIDPMIMELHPYSLSDMQSCLWNVNKVPRDILLQAKHKFSIELQAIFIHRIPFPVSKWFLDSLNGDYKRRIHTDCILHTVEFIGKNADKYIHLPLTEAMVVANNDRLAPPA